MRGADILARTLKAAGAQRLFTLSGNQIMSVFDASLDVQLDLIHVRHEAAAVHMADAWGRLTGQVGVVLVTAGPGFANCLSALYVAAMGESPLVLLSGQAPCHPPGCGAFQDMPQSAMAAHVAKASWTVAEPAKLGSELAGAVRLARSGRPGPVQLSLPVDVLEAALPDTPQQVPEGNDFQPSVTGLADSAARQILEALSEAQRPLILAGPAVLRGHSCQLLASLAEATGVPAVGMESPRGVNDPSLGAFAEVIPEADVIFLLGKKLDFTLRVGGLPALPPSCRLIQLDADPTILQMTRRVLVDASPLIFSDVADPPAALETLVRCAGQAKRRQTAWKDQVRSAVAWRPPAWASVAAPAHRPLHGVEVCRAVQQWLASDRQAVFVSDGGEFGQWAQACVSSPRRVINGPSGAIGGAIPFALAARLAFPNARIVATLGDGTMGFHAMEFDTALRYKLPFVAVVGNDAMWNAEHQIQLRKFGQHRTVGCSLLATRYDQLVAALGGFGEQVTAASQLAGALERAHRSALPACLNVAIQPIAAPIIRRN